MSKDPAVLWYWNDWAGGTATFNRHLKGCYIDLLHAQFNTGLLSLEEIKTVLGADFGPCWPTLSKKFKADESGLFYNERAKLEQLKRQKFTQSRVNNLKSHKEPHMGVHMGGHMENRNDNVLQAVQAVNQKWNSTPTEKFDLTPVEISHAIEFVDRLKQIKLDENRVKDCWIAFQTNQFTGEKHYASRSKCMQHFREWLKTQGKNDTKTEKKNRESSIPDNKW